jgi:inhibitor of cysteine peptidase
MKRLPQKDLRLAALGLAIVCGACLVRATETTMAGDKEIVQVTLTDKDTGAKQKLSQGQLLVVHLETQPGTGFGWVIAKCDKEELTLLSSVLLDNPNKLPGGKAAQVFTFRAAGAGASELELHYQRPFDKEMKSAKTFKITVAVEQKGKQMTLTDKDNGAKQKLSRGDTLVVHLEAQPGTGFGWVLAKSDKDQLTLLSSVLLDNPGMLPGGKSFQVFTFRATSVGASELELQYKRSFEKDKEPAQTFKVPVTIGE